ncbi:MAG: HEAT repeat domain-containing protein [Leptolyngbyaceae cyanobacterium RM2_2_4]|nr:HEAT repeat domain-containing protein [Leptolyngbyaceae cyanobacterium SM1_4_3]NJN58033.1 HEAT repeat domain-containing protein [Leptolyngbyaceae cyanobacterium SL_5_9]NJO48772.1 HEAT repeat domain-containing protein [Leptolyngbyaceae cyanobacterium RM2_2_4]NJO66612.1 HEAT repeat domain-containing protein [Leptolyngbyaceae cyanobacterium RM1_405_57]
MVNSLDPHSLHSSSPNPSESNLYGDSWSNCVQPLSVLASQHNQAIPQNRYAPALWLDVALNLLVEGDFQTRWDVAKLLPRFGPNAIAPLIEILQAEVQAEEADWELLWFTVRLMGEFNHAAVIPVLINLLNSQGELGAAAAEALANLGNPAIPALTDLLALPEFRLLAVRSLSRIRHSETIAPLLSVVTDPQPTIRAAAIEALSSFHDPRIFPVLAKALQDPAASVRQEAVTGLGVRTVQTATNLVDLLAPYLTDLNPAVCRQAAIALGRLGNAGAIQALVNTLRSPHTPLVVQIEIVRSLSWALTADVLSQFRDILPHASAEVYSEIVAALSKVEESTLRPQSAKILIDLLKAESSVQLAQRKQSIALSLGHLGAIEALEPLICLLADSDLGVQLHAIAALKQLNADAAYKRLKTLSEDQSLSKALQQGVAIALREW